MTAKSHIQVLGAVAPPPKSRPASPAAPVASVETGGGVMALFCVLLFLLALPTETGAWYWAGQKFDTLGTQGVKTAIPQYILWAILPFAVILHLNSFGLKYYKRSVGLFLPFLLIGIASALHGVFPIYSLRLIIVWMACASVAVIVAGGLNVRQGCQLLFYAILTELVLSIILALFFKSAGVGHDSRVSSGTSWNGVFTGRILLGDFACWGFVFTLLPRKVIGLIPTLCMLLCASLCLYESHAAGVFVAAACTLGFVIVVVILRRTRLSTTSKALILGLGSVTALVITVIALPLLLAALNRDATLTGRTEIWQLYIPRALEHPILGQGPGSFTAPSQVTAELFYRLAHLGEIRTPHNAYIAALGEAGVFGLIALVGALFYTAFVLPFRNLNSVSLLCGAGAVLIMVNGLSETDMVFSPSSSLFILIFLLSMGNNDTTNTNQKSSYQNTSSFQRSKSEIKTLL